MLLKSVKHSFQYEFDGEVYKMVSIIIPCSHVHNLMKKKVFGAKTFHCMFYLHPNIVIFSLVENLRKLYDHL